MSRRALKWNERTVVEHLFTRMKYVQNKHLSWGCDVKEMLMVTNWMKHETSSTGFETSNKGGLQIFLADISLW